jgi:hypothetical protein
LRGDFFFEKNHRNEAATSGTSRRVFPFFLKKAACEDTAA